MKKLRALIAMLATALVFGGAITILGSPAGAEGSNSALVMSIAEVNLQGPVISDVTVTLKNTSNAAMTDVSVVITGPINWTLYPETQSLSAPLAAGASATVTAEIHVPNNPSGSVTRNFTAAATYAGGDGVKTSFAQRNQFTGPVPASLAELFDNVGTTTVGTTAQGDYDGGKNSFSREKLALKGYTPGAKITAAGTEFTWPSAEPGKPDNVTGSGQTFKFEGQGSKIAFLGSGVHNGAVGEATVHYTDGSSSKGTFGFPNWGFQEVTAHGASLAVEVMGRNTPAGFANEEFPYRMFTNTIAIDASKTVSMVTLPNNANLHVFAIAFVPAVEGETLPAPTAPATTVPATSAPATTDPSVAPSTEPTTEPTTDPATEPVTTKDPVAPPTTGTASTSAAMSATATTGAAVATTHPGGSGSASPTAPEASGGDDDLAMTGSSAAPLIGMGGLLLVGGLVLMVSRRRQRSNHS
ncbi:NEW3 domain-containing protein [Arthrobacter psychrochitiniphilus]|uniref:NEW3 domain-containing protein n=1 Tax=Arthrobacter psychrochitiniphilus TaxID=291045 RepID=UPI003F7BEDC5